MMLKKVLKLFSQNKLLSLLLLLGTATWSITMVKSGLIYPFGMGFWGPNGHDGIWHIALINHLSKGSWQMPVFAGEALQNYHVGFDFLLATINRITTIPSHTLYFQIFPPILAFTIGTLTYKFVYSWRKEKKQALWSVFFVYFGGSLGWLINLIRNKSFGGESMFWAQQSISTLINPPYALSLVIILCGLIGLTALNKKYSLKVLLLTSLAFGVLVQVKIYAGLLVLGSLFFSGIWQKVKEKKMVILKTFLLSFIISAILFFSGNNDPGNLIVFKPFWFLETMMGLSDRLGWARFASAMTNYKLAGNWFKGILAYTVAFFIFWYGNMGTRLIQEIGIFKWVVKKKITFLEIFLFSIILMGATVPMFFLQSGTPWNTIQFFYYSLFFSGILAGITVGELKLSKIALSAIVIFTIPTTFATLRHYLPSRPPAKISHAELEALSFLSGQTEGIVLTYPYDQDLAKAAEANPPRPLYLYESTAYVTAFSSKQVYLEDEVNLNITGYGWPERRKKINNFLNTLDQAEARTFLKENDISYVYWVDDQRAKLGESQLGIEKIFGNEEVNIYKVN